MNYRIQCGKYLEKSIAKNAGFELTEYSYEDVAAGMEDVYEENCGLMFSLEDKSDSDLYECINIAINLNAPYIVIGTNNVKDKNILYRIIENNIEFIRDSHIKIFIENGVVGNDNEGYSFGPFSDSWVLEQTVDYFNRLCENRQFFAALDIGLATLLEKNVPRFIFELKNCLAMIHINDNDGRKNLRQMPYTFTTGRGTWSTEWNKILGAIIKTGFDGEICFNTNGLFISAPDTLHLSMTKLLKAIADRWQQQMCFEDVLKAPGKKIILFGAGNMAANYMKNWGEKYRPAFLVDNCEAVWGKTLEGVPIKSPREILDVPADERLVLLCNAHYSEIKIQLTGMGVEYVYYNDEFYPLFG